MATQDDLIKAIINKKLKEELNQNQNYGGLRKSLDDMNARYARAANFGNRLSDAGSFLKNHSSLDKIGTGMQTVGNTLQSSASTAQKAIPTSSSLMSKIGSKITSALPSALTNSLAKIGIGTTGSAVASGAATGATSGAVGGSAASGAAAAGPIGALIALGSMIFQGTNRKRAKQAAQQAQQLSEAQNDIAKSRLANTSLASQEIANQASAQPNIEQIQASMNEQSNSITKELIDNYVKSSISENNVPNNAPESLVSNNSYQNLPTPNEAKKNVFNNLADGLANFIKGYQENKNQAFSPDNLKADDSKGAMQRIGEGIGTATRLVQNPTIQGIIAGGLSGALSGDPLYGLGMAYKFTNNKKNSDLFRDILTKQGVDGSVSNGTITSDDMSKILAANKYQKGFMTRKDYDRLRLENGLITIEEYNAGIASPDYNPDEMVNITGLEAVSKAGRNAQQNKNDRNTNYYRAKNEGKNVVKVEYGEKPDSHNYTHVTYGPKPEQKNTTHVTYGAKPEQKSSTHVTYGQKPKTTTSTNNSGNKNNNTANKNNSTRVKVKSPDGKVGSIPASQLIEAIKQGFKKI